VRMVWRFGEDIPDDALCEITRALVLFLDDEHGHPGFEVYAGLSVHGLHSMALSRVRCRRAQRFVISITCEYPMASPNNLWLQDL